MTVRFNEDSYEFINPFFIKFGEILFESKFLMFPEFESVLL